MGHAGDEYFTWDSLSRLSSREVQPADPIAPAPTFHFAYDGSSRLVEIERADRRSSAWTLLDYDVDDQVVREHRTDSDLHIEEIYRFEGWRHDAVSGETIEAVLPMMKMVRINRTAQARWTLTEPDGHTLATYSPSGTEVTFEVAGAYGRPLPDVLKLPYKTGDFASAATWPIESVHGLEPDRHLGLVHAGARHFFARDGMWMQPEPLLHLGLWNADPGQPVALGGVYAGGDPVGMADRDGYFVQVLAPAAGAALVATATVAAVAYYANDGPAKTSALVTSAAGALASAWQGDKQAEAAQDPGGAGGGGRGGGVTGGRGPGYRRRDT